MSHSNLSSRSTLLSLFIGVFLWLMHIPSPRADTPTDLTKTEAEWKTLESIVGQITTDWNSLEEIVSDVIVQSAKLPTTSIQATAQTPLETPAVPPAVTNSPSSPSAAAATPTVTPLAPILSVATPPDPAAAPTIADPVAIPPINTVASTKQSADSLLGSDLEDIRAMVQDYNQYCAQTSLCEVITAASE